MERLVRRIFKFITLLPRRIEFAMQFARRLSLTAILLVWLGGWAILLYYPLALIEFFPQPGIAFKILPGVGLLFASAVLLSFFFGLYSIWSHRCGDERVNEIGALIFLTSWPIILLRILPALIICLGKKIIAAGHGFLSYLANARAMRLFR